MKKNDKEPTVKKLTLERETVRVHVRTGVKAGFTYSVRNGTLTGTGMGDIEV
jgi:hypothetical protein